jgi:aminoglycoside 3-N-acetyltransferase
MHKVTLSQLLDTLTSLGIHSGDNLLVHSAIQFLGKPEEGLETYLRALQTAIRPQGTLAVPTFNFGFARGERFDRQETPAQGMGVFSEYVRQQPEAKRTPQPLQSLALIGPLAEQLSSLDTPCAFDPGSAFEKLLELDFKLLLLGADVQAVSMIHYSEQRARVPYRYWKDFRGEVRTGQGWEMRTYRMFARDLELDPQLDLRPVQALLEQRGQWQAARLNYGWLSTCKLKDFAAAADDLLAKDPWAIVTQPLREH